MRTRVLMTADAVGGVWTYALELARALRQQGLSTTIATMGPRPSAAQLAQADGIADLEIVSSDFQLEWMEAPWSDVAESGEWLLDLEARVRPLVVHLNGYVHGALPWRAPVVVVGHSCLRSWQEATGHSLDANRLAAYQAAVEEGVRSADWVVAPTAAMLGSLQRHYGPLARTSVVHNGRDAARFRAAVKEPFVATGGRVWDPAKNIHAMRSVAPHLSWPLVVAGDGDASEGTVHVGQLSEAQMATWLGRASIFALPARYEPFGLLPLEAALSGCALVLGDIPSLREVWGAAADFVDPGDHERLRAAIEDLIASPRRRAARAAAAHDRAVHLTPSRMARDYVDVYSCAASRGRTRAISCAS